ncbi:MAG: HAD-IIIC family phosphatase [Candidatus Thiodiazotropha weberae]|nr:HAD-IIIC family phosphatase [Candidatus Thiodiazotropha lotti]MCG8012444.1 HAD-IIIC family phosphatase [Candidatus Thiodiazotropha lotti]MCW4211914.1 HAD-IIIC family phosphatase [Candidatus Thiodiazotropha lotti]MCW4215891.1 HAD-IIIC family phosphatase [Candidatus Thiodiazotropha lotti]
MFNRNELADKIESNINIIMSDWFDNQFSDEVISRWGIQWATNLTRDHVISAFLTPLIRLMLAYLRTDKEVYLYGYLNERLRYAPHRQSPVIRSEYFKYVLEKDIQSVLANIDIQNDQKKEVALALIQLHDFLTEISDENSICMFALGDCLMTEVREFLPQMCRQDHINLDMRCIYFSASIDRSIDLDEIAHYLKENKIDVITMSFLSYDALPIYSMLLRECKALSKSEIDERLDMIIHIIMDTLYNLRQYTEATFLLHNTSGLPLGRYRKRIPFLPAYSSAKRYVVEGINERIKKLANSTQNTILIDEYAVANSEGLRKCSKAVYPDNIIKGGMLHTAYLGYYLSMQYQNILQPFNLLRKCKAIMVDFDNTLWEGVMADGKVKHYNAKQNQLKNLKDMGILLVSVSKNTIDNIRWDEMVLQEDDFVLHKINWDMKVNSISSAISELNIGVDSIVFIDDNPVELDMVKQELNDIVVLDATNDKTWSMLEMIADFPNTKETEESRNRTKMYRESFDRDQAISSKKHDYQKLMSSLELKVGFRQAQDSDLERIYELVNRTNQFNTTTIRYTKNELNSMMKSDTHKVSIATLSDKFGSLGVVLVVIIDLKQTEAVLSSFIMSCRAMGFAIENQILHLITKRDYLDRDRLIGIYSPTDRNTPCAMLYSNNNFTKVNNNEWFYEIDKNEPINEIGWISMQS